MNLWQELKEESRNLVENYRELAKHGMGTETKNSIKVGTEIDYYRADGAKYMGKVTKMTPKGYIVKDDKNGKNYQFTYHDRTKAKKLLAKKTDKLSNIIKKNTIKKGKFAGYMTDEVEVQEGTMAIGIFDSNPAEKRKAIAGMQKLLKGKQNVKVGSPEGRKIGDQLEMKYLSDDELADDFIKPSNKNMTISQLLKKHEKRLGLKFKEEVEEAVSPAQQAAIAIAKKKKNESVMDSYRQMWESENLEEKKEFKQNDIDKVAKLTDRNEHTKSLIHIAKSMGDKKSVKKLELIDKLHNEYGHMSMELGKLRNEIYDDLKKDMEKYSNGKEMYNAT
jgi:hypothetical protein